MTHLDVAHQLRVAKRETISFSSWFRGITAVVCILLIQYLGMGSTTIGHGVITNALAIIALELASPRIQRVSNLSPISLFSWSHLLLFVVRPFRMCFQDLPNTMFGVSITERALGLGLRVGAIGAFSVTVSIVASRLANRQPKGIERRDMSLSRRQLRSLTFFWSVYAVLGYGVFLRGANGVRLVLAGRSAELDAMFRVSSALFYAAPYCLVGIGLMWLVTATDRRDRRIAYFYLAVSQVPGLLTGSRSVILLAVLSAAVVIADQRTERRPVSVRLRNLVALILTISAFGLMRDLRNADSEQRSIRDLTTEAVFSAPRIADGFLLSVDTAMFVSLGLEAEAIPERVPYRGVAIYAGGVAQVIPSAVFPDKPTVADNYLSDLLLRNEQTGQTGFSFSIYGEAYLALGFLGVVSLGLIAGWALLKLGSKRPVAGINGIAVAVITATIPIFFRGSFSADWLRAFIALAPWLVLRLSGAWSNRAT